MKLAKKLKKLRSKNKLTIKEVSIRLNVTMKKVAEWEMGVSIPSTKELYLLSDIYNVKSKSLFSKKLDTESTIIKEIDFFKKPFNKRKVILNVIAIFLIIISITSVVMSAIYMEMLSTPKDSLFYTPINRNIIIFSEIVRCSIVIFVVAIFIIIINFLIDYIKKKRIEKLKKKGGGINDN